MKLPENRECADCHSKLVITLPKLSVVIIIQELVILGLS